MARNSRLISLAEAVHAVHVLQADLIQRFVQYGGIPKYVLAAAEQAKQYKQSLQDALAAAEPLEDLLRLGNASAFRCSLPYMLLHFEVGF